MTQRSVKSYLYEGVVIVASILVAFALDAFWADYQESKVEERALIELRGEFQSARERIKFSIDELEAAVESTNQLAAFIGNDTPELSSDDAVQLFNDILQLNTLEVPSSVLDSIIASGQVRLISNTELQHALAEWPSFVADVRENHEWHRVETDEWLVPYLAEYIPVRDSLVGAVAIDVTPSTLDFRPQDLQRDKVFEGRLLWRISRQNATLSESNLLLEQTDRLLALIDAEIG